MTQVITKTVQAKYDSKQDYHIEVVKDKYIIIKCTYLNAHTPKPTVTKFELGDVAEYDRWNLIYTGKIVKITENTVTIDPGYGSAYKRLRIGDFAHKNYKFNAKEVAEHNAEESQYI